MYRVYYYKESGIINCMVKSKLPQESSDDRFLFIDFDQKPELYMKKIDIETKQIVDAEEPDQIEFPQARRLS